MSHCCGDDCDPCPMDDEIDRLQRAWERSEDQLIKEIRKLQDQLEEANLEIRRLESEVAHG